jgi:hypothetical protein
LISDKRIVSCSLRGSSATTGAGFALERLRLGGASPSFAGGFGSARFLLAGGFAGLADVMGVSARGGGTSLGNEAGSPLALLASFDLGAVDGVLDLNGTDLPSDDFSTYKLIGLL